ncbi:MAG TPA: ATP-binding protein [Methylomirabilota bacterium]|nr:ATP-binding protein [Methylomirabilota bacterium]
MSRAGRGSGLELGIRHKLVILSVLILLVVSFGFTALNLTISRGGVEEDLSRRAVIFTRELAATIADRRELENGDLLRAEIDHVLAIRQNVLQLDILAFEPGGSRVVASSHPRVRLPFSRKDVEAVLADRLVSRLISETAERYWEVMAPVTLEGAVVGAVAVKFSLAQADRLAARLRAWALALTAASVVVMAVLMGVAVRFVVDRPLRRFLEAIERVREGETGTRVGLTTADEFGVLARHFDAMVARINRFNDELRTRIQEATGELDRRYQEVQRLNELLFEMQRRLSHAERVALSGRIMAEVAHEVGTPLHSVAGHLELLRKDLSPELLANDAGRRLEIIEAQVARVIEIIARLLDLTRRSPGELAPVDLNRLVRDGAELIRPGLAAAGVALEVDTDPALPTVQGYQNELLQVVLNLLTNALDASPPAGRVAVTTRAWPQRGEAEIEVRDTGRGIPAAHRKQIFEPFFSTKESGQGTGLGLFISAQIVREHRGRIDVESEEGGGSTFRVVLPTNGVTP